MDTKIYSVFPACGKTWLYKNQEAFDLKILDSDSSQFHWMYRKRTPEELAQARIEWESIPHLVSGAEYIMKIKDEEIKVPDPEFPHNYIKHIKENIGKVDVIFVSTHESVRKALEDANIDFTIVYPADICREEWVGRCFAREKNGESGCSADLMYRNWERWLLDCFEAGYYHKEIVLQPTEHLSCYFRK